MEQHEIFRIISQSDYEKKCFKTIVRLQGQSIYDEMSHNVVYLFSIYDEMTHRIMIFNPKFWQLPSGYDDFTFSS